MSRIVLIDCTYTGHHPSYAETLVRALKADGHTVVAIGPMKWYSSFVGLLDKAVAIEQPEFRLSSVRGEWIKFVFLCNALKAAALERPDIVHLLWFDHYIMAASLALILRSVPISMTRATIHWGYMLEHVSTAGKLAVKDRVERMLLRCLARKGARFMVHSKELKQSLSTALKSSIFFPVSKGAVDFVAHPLQSLPEVAGDESRSFVLSKTNWNEKSIVILLFGGWANYKGTDLAVAALANLPQNYQLLIAGQMPVEEKDNLFRLASKNNVFSRLYIHDKFVSDAEIPLYFKGSDVTLIPYRRGFSGLSGPLVLAAALGVPILAARLPGLEEIIQRYQLGAVFEPEDACALAASMQSLVTTNHKSLTDQFILDHNDASFLANILNSYFPSV